MAVALFTDNVTVNAAMLNALVTATNAVSPIARQLGRTTTASITSTPGIGLATWDLGTLYNIGDLTSSGGVFTVATAGLYRWGITASWPSPASNYSASQYIWLNGVEPANSEGKNAWWVASGSTGATHSGGGEIVLAVADTVQAVVYQNSGATIVMNPRTFTLVRVG